MLMVWIGKISYLLFVQELLDGQICPETLGEVSKDVLFLRVHDNPFLSMGLALDYKRLLQLNENKSKCNYIYDFHLII